MKILHVVASYLPAHRYGGLVECVHGLCRSLAAQGAEVTVFTTNIDGPDNLDVPLDREVLLDGVKVHYFPVGRPRFYARSPKLAAALSRRVKEFDLVHVNGLYLYPGMMAGHVARRSGVPYITSPHGMLDPFAIAGRSSLKKRLYLHFFEKKNLERATAMHYTSEDEQRLAETVGSLPTGIVVPNALDLADFPVPGNEAEKVEGSTVLFLGRIDSKKGLDLLVPAFARVVARRADARLVLAGPDNCGYLSQVRTLVADHALEHAVSYVGVLRGQAKLQALRSATLLVLPSYSENFGMVVIEALACGTPVVVSDRVNIHGLVVQAGAGLSTPCQPEAVAEAILTLLEDPERARQMGRCGRALVEEQFTWDRVAAQMLEVYGRFTCSGEETPIRADAMCVKEI